MAAALVVPAMLGAGALGWWLLKRPAPPEPAPVVAMTPQPASPVAPIAAAEHPIDAVRERLSGAQPGTAPSPRSVADELRLLLGREAVLRLVQLDDFPRRFVATVDNLGRDAAPAQTWPVNPTAGRFRTLDRDGRVIVDPDNDLRYAPFVQMVEAVDPRAAVAAYVRLYPELQQAYEQIGFPGRHFNTRVVEVIDLLLATPVPSGPREVVLPRIRGPIEPPRPWVLYEFADPERRRLAAGQQWLLRMGPVNQRRLQARLAELRALIASQADPAPR